MGEPGFDARASWRTPTFGARLHDVEEAGKTANETKKCLSCSGRSWFLVTLIIPCRETPLRVVQTFVGLAHGLWPRWIRLNGPAAPVAATSGRQGLGLDGLGLATAHNLDLAGHRLFGHRHPDGEDPVVVTGVDVVSVNLLAKE